MKADHKAASIIHEFLNDKYGRVVLYDQMVYFWKLSKLNNWSQLNSKQHEVSLAQTMCVEQTEDGGIEGALQQRERQIDALIH
jgi:hypothetical protein